MLDNSESMQKNLQFQPRMSSKVKIINAIGSLVLGGGFVFMIFFTTFYKLPIQKWEYFTLNYTFIIIGLYYLLQSLFAIINNRCFIPSLKKKADYLPMVAIQIIGYHEKPEIFVSILTNIKNFTYPKNLIRRIVFSIDGYDDQNTEMLRVFKEIFPDSVSLQLKQRLSDLSHEQQARIIKEYSQAPYLVVTQPHGGRREVKYTAFSFSNPGTDYVLHSDSDTIVGAETLQSMCRTAIGYNKSGKLCGGVVGEVTISNVVSYFALQMQISYWYAFHCGRASQSLFGGVTTISGALGLFQSQLIKQIIQEYRSQYFCKIKCVYGQDRFLTSKILERGAAVLFDPDAVSSTQTPYTVHALITQQTRWYKGFYRQTIISAPKFYQYDCWALIILAYSFFVPFLVLFNLFYVILLSINNFAMFSIYIFVATFLLTFRIVLRTRKLRYFHNLWHPLFFFFFLLPSKLWAFVFILICFPDGKGTKKMWMKVIHMYIWIVVAGGIIISLGFVYNIVIDKQRFFDYYVVILLVEASVLILLLIHWMIWGWIFLIPKTKVRLQELLNIKTSQQWGSSKFIQNLNSQLS